MIGRRSVWSDDRVIELAREFVPATDEVWRLQHRDEPECRFFQRMAKEGHYRPDNSTQQGIYVCAPSGRFLASINSNQPERVLAIMKRGLKLYRALDPDERKLSDPALVAANKRMEHREPSRGLVLEMIARDIPRDGDPDETRAEKWNRDMAWFTQREARSLVPGRPSTGDTYDLPPLFVNRLVALHMVDTVNGQTKPFEFEEVKGSRVAARVSDVTAESIELEFSGKTHSESTDANRHQSPRGVVTNLKGSATWNRRTNQFSRFELVAVGHRWGYTRFNDRRGGTKENSNPLGFVFRLANPDEPPTVPAFIWAYKAPWVYQN